MSEPWRYKTERPEIIEPIPGLKQPSARRLKKLAPGDSVIPWGTYWIRNGVAAPIYAPAEMGDMVKRAGIELKGYTSWLTPAWIKILRDLASQLRKDKIPVVLNSLVDHPLPVKATTRALVILALELMLTDKAPEMFPQPHNLFTMPGKFASRLAGPRNAEHSDPYGGV